ncbi:copper chaperone PCu(A)C [Paractinoplanes lichenicola]|uniref:Copper chaperone PCu(A)C n=1 Tax=Paractinoplanes lichenicola TaxID=2802976 RepID=A0ABS1VYI1_9ACTN|nr:copper chaperone PCu(A)C [Actinoplanes lichenicola]MBL7259547.1 copper chaperone PCu(A)C [Actinoplanes lichenicola]
MRNTLIAVAALAVLGLTGCAKSDDTTTAAGGTPAPAPSATAAAGTLTIKDPWVKASAAGTMTAAFGTLVNDTGADITITGAESPASPLELHEMAMKDGKMVMQPKEGGFVIKSKGTHELSPGGDHLMLMKPKEAIEPGDEITFTLKLADGSTVPFSAIAKPFAGAEESYAPGEHGASGMPMGSMAP